MTKGIFLGFDFGYKRIGVAVGQQITGNARPLATLHAKEGIPEWGQISKLIKQWQPEALVVGLPTCINGSELYTTELARNFAHLLELNTKLCVHLEDERLSTLEARSQLFERGGYRKISNSAIDGIAACIILEQWLHSFQD